MSALGQFKDNWQQPSRVRSRPPDARDQLDRMETQYRAILSDLTELREEMQEFRQRFGMKTLGRPRVRVGARAPRMKKGERIAFIHERGSRW